MSTIISVQLDAVQALADELAGLAAALAAELPLCTASAGSTATALGGGREGWLAYLAANGWAAAFDDTAARVTGIATTLSGAVAAYRQADALLAQQMSARRPGSRVLAR